MAAAQLKDYYKILEVPPTAPVAEIKKAYRTLAFKYHPDTNPDNAYAATHFREVQEAWQVLQHEERRRNYDEERWLSGMSNRAKDQVIINPAWIYKESRKLSSHIATVDTYRMSHSALHDYIVLLLSDSHMAILQQSGEADTNQSIVKELLTSTATLKYQYMEAIAPRLAVLAGGDEELLKKIQNQIGQSSRKARWERHQPLTIIAIALLLCVLMYLWVRIK